MGPPYGQATTVNGNVQGEKQWQGWAQDLVGYADHQTDMANTRLPYASTGGKGTSVAAARAGSRNRGRGAGMTSTGGKGGMNEIKNWLSSLSQSGKGVGKKGPKKPRLNMTEEDIKNLIDKAKKNRDNQQKPKPKPNGGGKKKAGGKSKTGPITLADFKKNALDEGIDFDDLDFTMFTKRKHKDLTKTFVTRVAPYMKPHEVNLITNDKGLCIFLGERVRQEVVNMVGHSQIANANLALKGAAPDGESDDVGMEIMATVDRLIQLYEFKLASSFM